MHIFSKVEAFYQAQDWPMLEDGTHLSVGYDGKGVPIIRSQTDRKEESTAIRLSKGQKRGVKKEATISVSSSFTPKTRNKDDILNALFSTTQDRNDLKDKHQWHEQKHIRLFLSDKVKAISYGIDNLLQRDPSQKKPIIVLIDGDRALEKAV